MCEGVSAFLESALGIENGRCDHNDCSQQWNDNSWHDPLGGAKLPQENAPASLRRERNALSHRSMPSKMR